MTSDGFSRRAVLRGAAGAGAVMMVSAACTSLGDEPATRPPQESDGGASTAGSVAATVGAALAALADIPDGGGLIVTDQKVVVTNIGGTVHGFSAVCTHKGCTVAAVENGVIICPCHGSRFDAETGAVVGGPAERPLPTVAATVSDGQVRRG